MWRHTRRVLFAGLSLLAVSCSGLVWAGDGCPPAGSVGILVSPRQPVPGRPMRVVAVDATEPPGDLVVRAPEHAAETDAVVVHEGPPWSAVATVASVEAVLHRVEVRRRGELVACRDVVVGAPGRTSEGARSWNAGAEDLYAAWIEHLFAAPLDVNLGFPSLAVVLQDPERNFLHDHLGLDEDRAGPGAIPATPDCADLPYVLRAYFAWKMGLPLGFRRCSRGTATAPPRCGAPVVVAPPADVRGFTALVRRVADDVHSGNARTALEDDDTDFYPVPLERAALRPGTVYADPYGHTLVVVQWVPQTPERSGLLLAVDAQPDESVGRKRFWEGTFLFAPVPGAGPGFKAFRPLVRDASGGLDEPSNRQLASGGGVARWSGEQGELSSEAFYARMAALIDPDGLEPARAYEATLAALVEQLETRVRSVDNGEAWARTHRGETVPMPSGAAIFETTGPWEDYATPSRDLRLLIAMRVLEDLPARIVRRPDLYVLAGRDPAAARAEVERLHAARVQERAITYTRSDGTPWRLTVAELLARKERLEVAYDPNDCVEVRWGAAEGSAEIASCTRRSPPAQRARMEEYRSWFREGRRPSR